LTQAIIVLASQYGCFGYRVITALLKLAGWRAGKDRVRRIAMCAGSLCGPSDWASAQSLDSRSNLSSSAFMKTKL
jgi:hypothetical protein